MPLSFSNHAQELTYTAVVNYLSNSLFKDSMRLLDDMPRIAVLYQNTTLIEIDVLAWEVHPWEASELAIVRASSMVTLGSGISAELVEYLLTENRRMRFGAFQLDEAGQAVFAHSILGGEEMDLMELQTCILSVATIAATYEDIVTEKFGNRQTIATLG
ncbi:MAG: YbjN domain-containing protein [Leptolyngbyaceae cyanobacterium SL_7_1]|nr:YbjN domain-containing protein [Leptolyngbyaceae cyanobacterium SL_7_1]